MTILQEYYCEGDRIEFDPDAPLNFKPGDKVKFVRTVYGTNKDFEEGEKMFYEVEELYDKCFEEVITIDEIEQGSMQPYIVKVPGTSMTRQFNDHELVRVDIKIDEDGNIY